MLSDILPTKYKRFEREFFNCLKAYANYIYTFEADAFEYCITEYLILFGDFLGNSKVFNIGMRQSFEGYLGLSSLRILLDSLSGTANNDYDALQHYMIAMLYSDMLPTG